MSWMDRLPPGVVNFFKRKKTVPDNFWIKCPVSGQLVSRYEVEDNQFVIPESEYHMAIDPQTRFKLMFDDHVWEKLAPPQTATDPLRFRDSKRYVDRLKSARAVTESDDAIVAGYGSVAGHQMVVAIQDFRFIGGSLGLAAGDTFIAACMFAVQKKVPFVMFTASGGARMQEGIFSLMQMPRTTIAVQKLREAGLPYIVVLTNPTMGGVSASYGMLGDVHIAEPGAKIGFAGPLLIKQITGEDMPDRNQSAEFLYERGMIDMIVHRHDLKNTLGRLSGLLMRTEILAA